MRSQKQMEIPYEKRGPRKGKAYGIASVTQALEGADFPASKGDLLRDAGDKTIEWMKGRPMKLRDVLEKAPAEEYPGMAQAVSVVSNVMAKEKRKRAA